MCVCSREIKHTEACSGAAGLFIVKHPSCGLQLLLTPSLHWLGMSGGEEGAATGEIRGVMSKEGCCDVEVCCLQCP